MNELVLNRISVVITVFNCDELVKRSLDSLIVACGDRLPETIIVDNARLESTEKLIKSYASLGVQYIRMPADGGFAGANNVGYAHCTKDFVVLVNSDTVFHEEPFTAMVNFMDEHPKANIAQGTVVLKNGVPGEDGLLDDCGIFLSPFGVNEIYLRGKSPNDDIVKRAEKVYYAYGALYMIRRGSEKCAGGFLFHDHFYAYSEESDFCHRMWLGGGESWYVPTPTVDHAHSATFKKNFNGNQIRIQGLSNTRFSLLTCFGTKGILTVYPLFELFHFATALEQLLHGNTNEFKLQFNSLKRVWAKRKLLKETRKQIQGMRTVSDRELFKTIMRPRNPIAYIFYKLRLRRAH